MLDCEYCNIIITTVSIVFLLIPESEQIWVEKSIEHYYNQEIEAEWYKLPIPVVLPEILPLHVNDSLDTL